MLPPAEFCKLHLFSSLDALDMSYLQRFTSLVNINPCIV